MLRAAAVKDKKTTRFCQPPESGWMKENTFEVVEEILFRHCEVRVWKRVCERVEVEGGFHVGRWFVVKVEEAIDRVNCTEFASVDVVWIRR